MFTQDRSFTQRHSIGGVTDQNVPVHTTGQHMEDKKKPLFVGILSVLSNQLRVVCGVWRAPLSLFCQDEHFM